VGQS
jgi:hypothetical protein